MIGTAGASLGKWSRRIDANAANPALVVNQRGSGKTLDLRIAGTSVMNVITGAATVAGVEWDQSTDTWTRIDELGNAIATWPYDFDDLPPWRDMIRVTMDTSGRINTFGRDGKGSNLTLDGSDGRVMVQIPRFYVKAANPSANVYRWWISPFPLAGFELHPAFRQRGKGADGGADFIYVSAYEASLKDNAGTLELDSHTGEQPWTGGEMYALSFDAGQNEPAIGDTITGGTSGDAGQVVGYHVTSGTWGGNNAAGVVYLKNAGGSLTYQDNETLTNSTQSNTMATANGTASGEAFAIGDARTYAGNIGTDWGLMGIWSLSALQLLYYIEYADADSQTTIGRGIVDKAGGSNFAGEETGVDSIDSNIATNGTGAGTGTDGLTPIAYRGIENLWGNIWAFIDGYNAVDAEYRFINRDGSGTFADALAGGDYEASVATPITSDGYQDDIEWEDLLRYQIWPSSVTGASTSHLYDYLWAHDAGETNILLVGGSWARGDPAGVVSRNSYGVSSTSARHIGARLEFEA